MPDSHCHPATDEPTRIKKATRGWLQTDPEVGLAFTSSLRPEQQVQQQVQRHLCCRLQAQQLQQERQQGREQRQVPELLFCRKRPGQQPTQRPGSAIFSCQFLEIHDDEMSASGKLCKTRCVQLMSNIWKHCQTGFTAEVCGSRPKNQYSRLPDWGYAATHMALDRASLGMRFGYSIGFTLKSKG